MPDTAVHLSFGEEVRRSLPPDLQRTLSPDPYAFALLGPDVWFMHKPWIRRNGRGRRMHTTRTGEFLLRLAQEAKQSSSPALVFSYLAGFICHYALDSIAHPYIIRKTTAPDSPAGAHRAFEHSLDILDLERAGFWGERHPMTAHLFRPIRLPAAIRPALDAAYRRTYGWSHAWSTLNFNYRIFRFLYRLMENPRGLGALLVRLTGSPSLKSLIYSASPYAGADVENQEHRPWAHSHDDSLLSTDSFSDLREKARMKAVRIIQAAYDYIISGTIDETELAGQIGNDSYLSGLPMGDPRNLTVPSMLPADDPDPV